MIDGFNNSRLNLTHQEPSSHFAGGAQRLPFLLGRSDGGDAVTVWNSAVGQAYPLDSGDRWDQVLYPNFVFVGAHYTDEQEIEFKKIDVVYSHLDTWAAQKVFDIDIRRDDQGASDGIDLSYHKPEALIFQTGPIQIALRSTWEMNGGGFGPRFRLTHQPYFSVSVESPQQIGMFLKLVLGPLESFLTFAIGSGVTLRRFRGVPPDDGTEARSVKIRYLHRGAPEHSEDVEPMFFHLVDIQENATEYMSNWMEKCEWLGPVMNLHNASLYKRMYDENEFLNMTQALESYHRRVTHHTDTYLDETEYDAIYDLLVTAIPADTPPDLRAALKTRLQFGNELSLRNRLKSICEDVETVLGGIAFDDIDTFVDQVVSTRNYRVHLVEDLKGKAVFGRELSFLSKRLRLILRTVLLQELGMPESAQVAILESDVWYRELQST